MIQFRPRVFHIPAHYFIKFLFSWPYIRVSVPHARKSRYWYFSNTFFATFCWIPKGQHATPGMSFDILVSYIFLLAYLSRFDLWKEIKIPGKICHCNAKFSESLKIGVFWGIFYSLTCHLQRLFTFQTIHLFQEKRNIQNFHSDTFKPKTNTKGLQTGGL